MITYNVAGIYYAMLRNKAQGGGWMANGRTRAEAIANVLKRAGLL